MPALRSDCGLSRIVVSVCPAKYRDAATSRRFMTPRATLQALLAALCLLVCERGATGGARAAEEAQPILVFDAASLADVVEFLGRSFTGTSHVPVKSSPAACSALAKQIEAGAAADVFFSADREWMDYLDQKKLLKPGTRHNVVGNALVLIAPAHSTVPIKLKQGVDFGADKIATGAP